MQNVYRLTIDLWEKVCSFIMMESLMVSIQLKSMAKACISGKMVANTMENGVTTGFQALARTLGQMGDSTKESGRRIAWRV